MRLWVFQFLIVQDKGDPIRKAQVARDHYICIIDAAKAIDLLDTGKTDAIAAAQDAVFIAQFFQVTEIVSST